MKETTKMSRAVGQLEKMYNNINIDLFESALPIPIITVQSKPGTYGHATRGKIWENKDKSQYEMNIAAEMLNCDIEEILDTLIHEMIHIYCREKNIQDVSRGGSYHNGRFKALAESKGLVCIKTPKYGWNTVGKGNEQLITYALEKGWAEILLSRRTATPILFPNQQILHPPQSGDRRPSSTRKLQCPNCQTSVRATKQVRIMCMDCMIQMN